ncbi:thiamine-monophosphate kinase [Pseudomonas sp. BIGb0408]|uniref:Thiamine-monophosphate kinase n=1 Tax=Phytopseudomonas flavescens TaxID=29435 RepID=A0A7Y9XNV5_9GAMM|nr:thiamine-monophosphate kinase [Pseudomonas sp. BIGb0408]NYH74802.1 thiamine-monophosphate kinase [Pseudomonas flavescens]
MLGEFELIRHYFAAAACAQAADGVVLGIGDDCALLEVPVDEQLAVSTDTLVAGVHFPADAAGLLLGQRALAVSVSDLAAMGAAPLAFTLALTLPDAAPDWLADFTAGLESMARHCGVHLIGGDTTRGPLSLTLTVFGRVPKGLALTRAGARAGDLLCVGGSLGDAAGALPFVLGEQPLREDANALLAHYWSPSPQLALGQALRGLATAALDISDGLLADCGHIARASGVALIVEQQRLPLSAALRACAGDETARQLALAGGDDYVLAFTLPAEKLDGLRAMGQPVHVIGRVEAGQGVHLQDAEGRAIQPLQRGYQHFGSQRD